MKSEWVELKDYEDAHKRLSIMYGITSETCPPDDFRCSLQTQEVYREAMATTRLCSPIKSMKLCGRTPIPSSDVKSMLRIYKNTAFLTGNSTCGSCWCPNCMQRNRMAKIERITAGLEGAFATGKKAHFLTLTRERGNDPFGQINDLMSGWKAEQDKVSYQLKKQGLSLDFVRSLDITFKIYGKDIYHPHLHIIVVIPDGFTSFESWSRRTLEEIEELNKSQRKKRRSKRSKNKEKAKLFKYRPLLKNGKLRYKDGKNYKVTVSTLDQLFTLSWHDVMKKKGLNVTLEAQYIEEIKENKGIDRYMGKFQGMGLELMNFQNKSGKEDKRGELQKHHDSIGFMQLLGWVSRGSHKALQVYQEHICASHGTRVIGFSENWKELEKIGRERIEAREEDKPKEKETRFYNSDGDLIVEDVDELLFEREIPEPWIHFMNEAEFWLNDRYYVVIDIFPIAAFKAFHLGEIHELVRLLWESPHERPYESAYCLRYFLLKYWKPKYLPTDSLKELGRKIFNLENSSDFLYEGVGFEEEDVIMSCD